MKYILNVTKEGYYVNDFFAILRYINDVPEILHNSEYGLRHPLAIFNKGESRFLRNYNEFLNIISKLNRANYDFDNINWYDPIRLVLQSLTSFMDDIYSIFVCLYPNDVPDTEIIFQNRRFKRYEPALNYQFEKLLNDFNSIPMFSKINNELKHQNGSISTTLISARFYGKTCGFYIDGIDNNGCLIPNQKFHKEYRNMRTAFSSNWFAYEMLAIFLLLNEKAAVIIKQIITNKGLKWNEQSNKDYSDGINLIELINTLQDSCTNILFPDEYDFRPLTQITFEDEFIRIQNPPTKSFMKKFIDTRLIPYDVNLYTSGDGVSRTFGLVYVEHQ